MTDVIVSPSFERAVLPTTNLYDMNHDERYRKPTTHLSPKTGELGNRLRKSRGATRTWSHAVKVTKTQPKGPGRRLLPLCSGESPMIFPPRSTLNSLPVCRNGGQRRTMLQPIEGIGNARNPVAGQAQKGRGTLKRRPRLVEKDLALPGRASEACTEPTYRSYERRILCLD